MEREHDAIGVDDFRLAGLPVSLFLRCASRVCIVAITVQFSEHDAVWAFGVEMCGAVAMNGSCLFPFRTPRGCRHSLRAALPVALTV